MNAGVAQFALYLVERLRGCTILCLKNHNAQDTMPIPKRTAAAASGRAHPGAGKDASRGDRAG